MTKTRWTAVAVLAALGALAGWRLQAEEPAKPAAAPASAAWKFSGPYSHDNLTIFLIHGKDTIQAKKVLTLQEAMQQKKIVVHETSNVGELAVENVSDDCEIFIEAGDIVKGGKQDRALGYDLFVSAKSGKVPIQSFCVESGRWQKRGGESDAAFSSNSSKVNGKDLKLAISYSRNQGEVWNKVMEAQKKLEKTVGQSVQSGQSPSSLQLTLEDKKVLENVDKYVKELTKVADGKADAIGYVVVVNGKVEGADIYGSAELFKKLWPKLLNTCAVEALSELDPLFVWNPAGVDGVKKWLAEADQGKAAEKDVNKRFQVTTWDAAKNLVIETRDKEKSGSPIHRSYIAK